MALSPLAGKPAPKELLVDVPALLHAFDSRVPDLGDPAQRVAFGTSGHRGSSFTGAFTRAHILAITQAICDYRSRAADERPALPRQGHARAVGPGAGRGARSARRQRRGGRLPAGRRLHADAGDLPRDPRAQPRPHGTRRGRHRDHAVAQSAGGRRLQVQPAARRPGRLDGDDVDRAARERAARRRATGTCGASRSRARCGLRPPMRAISCCPMFGICRTSSTWRRSAPPASRSPSIRWAAPASATGSRSIGCTVSTSPSSTRRWIRRSPS